MKEDKATMLTQNINSMTVEECDEIIANRTNSPEFFELLRQRDEARNERNELDEKLELIKQKIETKATLLRGTGKNFKKVMKEMLGNGNLTPEEIRTSAVVREAYDTIPDDEKELHELTKLRLNAHYKLTIVNHDVEQYKDETVQYLIRKNELLGDPGTAYEGNTLGNCVPVATYDSGTREWLEERQHGIGGSDVGSMLKVDPVYGMSNFYDFIDSKTEEYSEAEVEAQSLANSTCTGPTGRGNAWEPEIIRLFAKSHPEYKVFYSKTSWANKDDARYKANVDGLLSSDGEIVDGILEIKTASHRDHWFDENGNPIIPLGYRAQVLWYLYNTGFKYAIIVAMIDDHELVVRYINADDFVDPTPDKYNPDFPRFGTMESLISTLNNIWDTQVQARKDGVYKKRGSFKSFFDKALYSDNIETTVRQFSAWSDLSHEDAEAYLTSLRSQRGYGMDEKIVEAFKQFGPDTWTRDRVYVDIETSGSSPKSGEVIEVGLVRVNPAGEVVFRYHERYGLLDERVLDISGTGMEELHHISPEDIRGKRNFRHPEVQAIMSEHLNDPNVVMVAHNESFERRWFNETVDGFYELHSLDSAKYVKGQFDYMYNGGERVDTLTTQDTMYTARYLAHHTDNNKLATFTEGNGVPYIDAHRADADAEMTMEANYAFNKLFVTAPPYQRYTVPEENQE